MRSISCTCIIHTINCGSFTRIVWVVRVVLHIPLNSLYTFFLFVWHASTIEFLVTMATIYRTNIAWWIEIVIVAVQSRFQRFLICASKTFYRMFSILWTKKKTKQNRVNAVVESAGIPYSNYNNYFSFEMIKWLKFNFQLTFNSFSIFFFKLGHFFYKISPIGAIKMCSRYHGITIKHAIFMFRADFSVNWILFLDIANSWTSIRYEQFNRFFRFF